MTTSTTFRPVIAIHGGAGTITRASITPAQQQAYRDALRDVLQGAQQKLAAGAPAEEVAVEAVRLLEECPLFNAGRGAVFTADATHEMDACVMRGRDLACGSLAGVSTVRNPVRAALALMEAGGPVFMIGEAAEHFAQAQGCEMVARDWFSTEQRLTQLRTVQAAALASGREQVALDHTAQSQTQAAPLDERKKMGTVGAVVLDVQGQLAAATSTGGLTNKKPGRVGDSPVVGAGTYAKHGVVAVSCTGVGEAFIRGSAAHTVAARIELLGESVAEATAQVIHRVLPPLGGDGGLIAVGADGEVSLCFNSEGMYRGQIGIDGEALVAIYANDALAPA
ncbi:isoaspartyl peptidase/L-asparaginase [Comamonas sp.]|uniref:isoaspartyl peptidase/L-asparaginase family protein n=1 Tax=Comamonas sp. TaxID=34028 RepID=UPI0028A1D318|nr:isoaspartyl peptidase/L-asparaginase [Comamonas sp.]